MEEPLTVTVTGCEGGVNTFEHRFPLAELWSVTMVFVSKLSNAIITLNSYC